MRRLLILMLALSWAASAETDDPPGLKSQYDFGAACDGSTDDTAALQRWLASGKNLVLEPGNCRATASLIANTANQKIFNRGGYIRFTANLVGQKWFSIEAPGVFAQLDVRNPNNYASSTGTHYAGINIDEFAANVILDNPKVDGFQGGIQQKYFTTKANGNLIINNAYVINVQGAGYGNGVDPQNCGTPGTEGCGEDRGDAIVCHGPSCTVNTATVQCAAGKDCRIGVHGEWLGGWTTPGERSGSYKFYKLNVSGPFRRPWAFEQVQYSVIDGADAQGGVKWWGSQFTGTKFTSISNTKIVYDRAASDTTGSSWSPVHTCYFVYGKNEHLTIDETNTCEITGAADKGAYIVGVDQEGLGRGNNVIFKARILANDSVDNCVETTNQDSPNIQPACVGYRETGVSVYDNSRQMIGGFINPVKPGDTKIVTVAITGTCTVGQTVTGGTSGTTGTLSAINATPKLWTIRLVSGAAYQAGETISTPSCSGVVSTINRYGKCVVDQNNTTSNIGGKYSGECYNVSKGFEVVGKDAPLFTGIKFDNAAVRFSLSGSSNEVFGDIAGTNTSADTEFYP